MPRVALIDEECWAVDVPSLGSFVVCRAKHDQVLERMLFDLRPRIDVMNPDRMLLTGWDCATNASLHKHFAFERTRERIAARTHIASLGCRSDVNLARRHGLHLAGWRSPLRRAIPDQPRDDKQPPDDHQRPRACTQPYRAPESGFDSAVTGVERDGWRPRFGGGRPEESGGACFLFPRSDRS